MGVFLDLNDIEAGQSWPDVLESKLQECALLIAVIGPGWLAAVHGEGPVDDVLRWEIATALTRNITVIPLLVETTMPTAANLPPELRDLASKQAFAFDLAHYERSFNDLAKEVYARLAV